MFARNRMADIVKLRCNACQDFLKMIIIPEWRSGLYEVAQNAVVTGYYKDKYAAVYDRMREGGIENYSIDDMDVTLISQVINYCTSIAKAKKGTREAVRQLAMDRNKTDHSSENEPDEELYRRGLLALYNLDNFIRIVDREETEISDELRLAYRQKYSAKIAELKRTLDDERIDFIQTKKNIEMDIKKVLESDDPQRKWLEMISLYIDKCKIDRDFSLFNRFVLKASDMKIAEAHGFSIIYLLTEKNYDEVERRLLMLYQAYESAPANECRTIVDTINDCLRSGYPLTQSFNQMITGLRKQGYIIAKKEDGFFEWQKKPAAQ